MKFKLTPFVKFFIITSIFTFVLGHINPPLVEAFLKLRTPFGPEYIPTQVLTYQLVPTGFLNLVLTSLIFAVYVSDMEEHYGSIRITGFFFVIGMIHALFIQSLGLSYALTGAAPSFAGFLILFLLRNWNNDLSFIVVTFKGSKVFWATVILCVLFFITTITTGTHEPTNLSSIVLACLFYWILDGKIRNKKLQA